MSYRKKVYVTIVRKDGTQFEKMYVTTTLRKIIDKVRLLYDFAINIDSVDESEAAPAVIYQGRRERYRVEIHKVICA